jgi:hypothetical protein
MFIVVGGKPESLKSVPAYLYAGQSVITEEPIPTFFGAVVIVDTGSDDLYRAEYVRDRISSGLFGAKLFQTREEADAYIEEQK